MQKKPDNAKLLVLGLDNAGKTRPPQNPLFLLQWPNFRKNNNSEVSDRREHPESNPHRGLPQQGSRPRRYQPQSVRHWW